MRYFVTLLGRTIEVEVEAAPGGPDGAWRIRVGEREHVVDCRETTPDELSLRVDAEVATFLFDDHRGQLVAHDGLFAYPYVVEDERERLEHELLGTPEGAGPETVRSVMPGIIASVLVEEGQPVEAGQPLVIMEAMKMENEVRAERAGAVARVLVKARDTVEAGQALVELA